MISLDHLLLDAGVFEARFACDVARCKGACCTLPGGAGAPLQQGEVEEVQRAISAADPYLSERSREHLALHGAVERTPNGWATSCIDDRDCVFVVYDGDVATCAIEKAWHAGTSSFRKPLSCHLFPIRIADFGGPYVHYEQFSECAPGRERGEREGIRLLDAVQDALARAFGRETTDKIMEYARSIEHKGKAP